MTPEFLEELEIDEEEDMTEMSERDLNRLGRLTRTQSTAEAERRPVRRNARGLPILSHLSPFVPRGMHGDRRQHLRTRRDAHGDASPRSFVGMFGALAPPVRSTWPIPPCLQEVWNDGGRSDPRGYPGLSPG